MSAASAPRFSEGGKPAIPGDPGLGSGVRLGLESALRSLEGVRFPLPPVQGKLLRPMLALAAVPASDRSHLSPAFWRGALAVQMVHEASLVHDDIVDGAEHRRGTASLVSQRGVAAALVHGDHLLTGAFRVAMETGHTEWVAVFARAVEGTVAGEKDQCVSTGRVLDPEAYRRIISAKSGELFGAALALRGVADGEDELERLFLLGCRVGSLYQMVDDFLDYCPTAAQGKPPFQDYRAGKWTLPLEMSELRGFQEPVEAISHHLFLPGGGGVSSVMRRTLGRLRDEVGTLAPALRALLGEEHQVGELMEGWLTAAARALHAEEERVVQAVSLSLPGSLRGSGEAVRTVREEAALFKGPEEWLRYFADHGRSFRFASRLFPREARDRVAGVYAFCRFTDDLVDRRDELPASERERLLDAWLRLADSAYRGESSGVPLLDAVMGDAARSGVPFRYPRELVEGVRMDLAPRDYASLDELRLYSFRVASVVGLWLTRLFGTSDGWVLERAEAMGHAMQLTNILRDVGEDSRRGRNYLPLDRMELAGVSTADVTRMAAGVTPISDAYRGLVEDLLQVAEADYADALPGIPHLPGFFQGPVVVAAHLYRGIHREIRKAGCDNLQRRAYTSLPRKGVLAASAMASLRGLRRRSGDAAIRPEGAGPWLPAEKGREARA